MARAQTGLATMVFERHGAGLSTSKYTAFWSKERHPLSKLAARFKKDNPNKRIHRSLRLITKTYDLDLNPNATLFFVPKSLEPVIVLKVLPKILLARLLADQVLKMAMNDGMGSEYDARKALVSVKGTHDFIHEIGHHAWAYYFPQEDEVAQRDAVINAIAEDHSTRQVITADLIPARHKIYAQLVGAFDGQRLADGPITRGTDLDEHFARNFDYLMKRKPLSVLPAQGSRDIKAFLDLYLEAGLVDQEFIDSYRYIAKVEGAGVRFFKIESPDRFQDGDEVTMDRIALIHVLDAERRVGRPLTLTEELAIRLDITLGVAEFALAKDRAALIKTLELYGTGEPELVERVKVA